MTHFTIPPDFLDASLSSPPRVKTSADSPKPSPHMRMSNESFYSIASSRCSSESPKLKRQKTQEGPVQEVIPLVSISIPDRPVNHRKRPRNRNFDEISPAQNQSNKTGPEIVSMDISPSRMGFKRRRQSSDVSMNDSENRPGKRKRISPKSTVEGLFVPVGRARMSVEHLSTDPPFLNKDVDSDVVICTSDLYPTVERRKRRNSKTPKEHRRTYKSEMSPFEEVRQFQALQRESSRVVTLTDTPHSQYPETHSSVSTNNPMSQLTVKQLRQLAADQGLDATNCLEKSDLIQLISQQENLSRFPQTPEKLVKSQQGSAPVTCTPSRMHPMNSGRVGFTFGEALQHTPLISRSPLERLVTPNRPINQERVKPYFTFTEGVGSSSFHPAPATPNARTPADSPSVSSRSPRKHLPSRKSLGLRPVDPVAATEIDRIEKILKTTLDSFQRACEILQIDTQLFDRQDTTLLDLVKQRSRKLFRIVHPDKVHASIQERSKFVFHALNEAVDVANKRATQRSISRPSRVAEVKAQIEPNGNAVVIRWRMHSSASASSRPDRFMVVASGGGVRVDQGVVANQTCSDEWVEVGMSNVSRRGNDTLFLRKQFTVTVIPVNDAGEGPEASVLVNLGNPSSLIGGLLGSLGLRRHNTFT